MQRILVVFGTRPEAVKLAPVIGALRDHPECEVVTCITSQHQELLQQVLRLFEIVADFDLDVMEPNQDLTQLSARILGGLAPVLQQVRPAVVVVQGDTTSTFCAALAAFYQRVPVGHVEAGLRTGNFDAPFPEEMNRVVTTRLARWHFAPTEHNRETLRAEGVDDRSIYVTGNPVIDALHQIHERIRAGQVSAATRTLRAQFQRPYALVTGHRRESFGAPFRAICSGIARLAAAHPGTDFVYPVHLNPNVRAPVEALLGEPPNVHLLEPLDYEGFLTLMAGCRFVLTDSGGVQEEAPALGKPVLVMREQTERVEALGGAVRMVGADADRIFTEGNRLLVDQAHYRRLATAHSPYGDGHAARRIVEILAGTLRH